MDPVRGMLTAARTLSYYNRLQEVTTNNLANVSTAGFKGERLAAHRLSDVSQPIPVERTDLSQGALTATGRTLDLALEGEGFLVVETDAGERLIRGGSLRLDGAGRLVDGDGAPLLGKAGPIVVTGAVVEVRGDGTVLDDGLELDRLRVVAPAEDATLLKEAAGRFVVKGEVEDRPDTLVRQGHLESANVDSITTMVALVEIQRAYAANITAVRTMDGVMSSITGELGRVS